MAFKLNKQELQKSQKCPPGLHPATLVEAEEMYVSEKGAEVQKCIFETDAGYQVPVWFNDKVMSNLIEFVEAADKVKFDMENMEEVDINLKKYVGKKVYISVSHVKDKNNKIQAQIDNFYNSDKVPF